jgi:hypothetical protein
MLRFCFVLTAISSVFFALSRPVLAQGALDIRTLFGAFAKLSRDCERIHVGFVNRNFSDFSSYAGGGTPKSSQMFELILDGQMGQVHLLEDNSNFESIRVRCSSRVIPIREFELFKSLVGAARISVFDFPGKRSAVIFPETKNRNIFIARYLKYPNSAGGTPFRTFVFPLVNLGKISSEKHIASPIELISKQGLQEWSLLYQVNQQSSVFVPISDWKNVFVPGYGIIESQAGYVLTFEMDELRKIEGHSRVMLDEKPILIGGQSFQTYEFGDYTDYRDGLRLPAVCRIVRRSLIGTPSNFAEDLKRYDGMSRGIPTNRNLEETSVSTCEILYAKRLPPNIDLWIDPPIEKTLVVDIASDTQLISGLSRMESKRLLGSSGPIPRHLSYSRIVALVAVLILVAIAVVIGRKTNKSLRRIIVKHSILGFFFVTILATDGFAVDFKQDSNCVDSCIKEYCRINGLPIGDEDLLRSINSLGLDEQTPFRSLVDCRQLLAKLGFDTTAIVHDFQNSQQIPPSAIVYVPSPKPDTPGHVVVLYPDATHGYMVYDVEARDPRYKFNTTKKLGKHVCIVPSTYAAYMVRKRTIDTLAVATLILFSVFSVTWLFRRSKYVTFAFTVGLCSACSISCSPVHPKGIVVETPKIDLGILAVAAGDPSHTADVSFKIYNHSEVEKKLRIDRLSCGCLVTGTGDEISIPGGCSIELPMTVRLDGKSGSFTEEICLLADTSSIPIVLQLSGTVVLAPLPDVNELVFDTQCKDKVQSRKIVFTQYFDESLHSGSSFLSSSVEPSESFFDVSEPNVSEGVSVSGKHFREWIFEIHDRSSNGMPAKARVIFNWENPRSVAEVAVESRSSLECLPGVLYLPRLKVGKIHTEVIPINGNAMILLKTYDLHFSPPVSEVIVDENSGSIYIMVEPSEEGNVDEYIGFGKEGKDFSIHLVGKAK